MTLLLVHINKIGKNNMYVLEIADFNELEDKQELLFSSL